MGNPAASRFPTRQEFYEHLKDQSERTSMMCSALKARVLDLEAELTVWRRSFPGLAPSLSAIEETRAHLENALKTCARVLEHTGGRR